MGRKPLLVFSLIHAALFLFVFLFLTRLFFPAPALLERDFALKMLDGLLPYRDFPAEYPPLGLVSFLIPGLFFKEPLAYGWAFAAEMLVLDLIALALLRELAIRFNLAVSHVLGIYTVFVMAVGPLIVVRYDLLPAVLVLAAIWAFIGGKTKLAWGILGLGIMAKIYPIVVAPVFALYHIRHRQYAEFFKGAAILAAVLLAFALPPLAIDKGGFISMLTYHADRGLQWESTYASLLLVGQALGLTEVSGELSFGSWNLISPPLANILAQASMYVAVGLLLILYITYGQGIWRRHSFSDALKNDNGGAGFIVRYSALAVLVFLLANKVFSSQFMIWLCPVLSLISTGKRNFVPLLFIVAAGITQVLYPYLYVPLESGETFAVVLIAVRNFLLVAMAVLVVRLYLPDETRVCLSEEIIIGGK